MLGTGRLLDELVEAQSGGFQTAREKVGPLLMERCTDRWKHSLFSHLASGVEPVPRFERLDHIGVNRDGMVYLLH